MKRALRLALTLFLAAEAFAARPITPPAPEFPPNAAWINSKPFSLERLRKRRVVLLAFLDVDNLNSLRALAPLKTWQERYEQNGLLIVGVHMPELAFQRDPRRTLRQFKRFGVDFPVVLDADGALWKAYDNEGWPAFYLIDAKGRVVFDKLGEGDYSELEKEIRAELEKAGFEPVPALKKPADRRKQECGQATPEVSVGLRRGSPVNLRQEKTRINNTYLFAVRQGETGFSGSWQAEPDALRLSRDNKSRSAFIQILYRGAQAFALLESPPQGTRYYLRQDSLWLHAGNAGSDVRFDDDGRSFVDASEPRLYHLTQNPGDSMHALTVAPVSKGAAVYGFSFTDSCLALRLPR